MSIIDPTSKLSKQDAQRYLKFFSMLLKQSQGRVSFSSHFKKRVVERKLFWSPDALNVIHGGRVVSDGQLESKTDIYRYRVETKQMVLVFEFLDEDWIRCISGWRNRR